jgi:uncharacterized iron-regulated membrane protein
MKIFFRRIHLYLGLAAGLVILVACLTGAMLVFEKDIQEATNNGRYFTKPAGTAINAEVLLQRVRDSFPQARITGLKWYANPDRTVEVGISFPKKKDELKPKEGAGRNPKASSTPARAPGFTVFVDPYSGKIIEKYSYRETFFYKVFAMHRWLLGSDGSVGKFIVGIATLIFLFIIITGIILWWPRTRTIMQQRLSIRWGAGWKRINHDLHLVLGFYSAIFLFVIAFTGLAWSFEWFNNGIYTVTGSPLKPASPPHSIYQPGTEKASPDTVLFQVRTQNATAKFYNLQFAKDSTDPLTVQVLPEGAVHESATNAYYFDQYTGKPIGQLPYSSRSLGARVRSTFKPVHTGSIGGWPTKILAFIVCLFGVSFPVTGTIMWINRTRKKKRA